MLQTGEVLQERYEIVRPLGAGGMARVYLARDVRLGERHVAIKEMNPSQLSEMDAEWFRDAFNHEAQVLANLSHAGIARVTDFFEHGRLLYLVMEYVEGETLAAMMHRTPHGFSESQVLAWATQLIDVLDYLHGRTPPVIFRDLKPDNIILRPDGVLKLVDFGIARYLKPEQSKDTVQLGTPGYAAPESYGRGQTTPRSDIYSLGVLLHQLLTGHDPTTTPVNLPPVRDLAPAVSPHVARALDKALATNPAERYATARDFGQALGIYKTIEPLKGTTETVDSLSGRRRTYAILAVGTILLLAGLWWGFFLSDNTHGNGEPVAPRLVVTSGRTSQIQADNDESASVVEDDPTTDPVEEESPDRTRSAETIASVGEEETGENSAASATVTPTSSATSTPSPSPTPSVTPLPTNTSLPTPTMTPLPTITPPPTRCSASVSSTFRDRYDDSLGCPTHGGRSTYTALENFERGYMIWREDTDEIYAIYTGGTWDRFGDLFAETMPDYSCGVEQSPPTPRRGFGMIWCRYDHVRQGLGNATNAEWGATSTVQDYANGTIIRTDMGTFVLYSNGAWR